MSAETRRCTPTPTPSAWRARLLAFGAARPGWYYTAPVVGWLLVICWLSLAPEQNMPPLGFEIPGGDKIQHGLAYALLALLVLRDWLRGASPAKRAMLGVWLAAAGLGIYIELLQGLTGYRELEPLDALSNGLGALIGVLLWRSFGERLLPTPPADIPTTEPTRKPEACA